MLGRMVTMDPQQPQVSAVAISNGRFSFVGDQAAALALRGPDTRVIDLEDATAYPGSLMPTCMLLASGPRSAQWISPGASSFSELIDRVPPGSTLGRALCTRPWLAPKQMAEAPAGHIGIPHPPALSEAVPDTRWCLSTPMATRYY
ncbi:MAG: hypothetical protein CM15mP74_23680 [Halieaceae bacterium]|nr:MAG: hypothetical protein CM15mP74_23680 [Halieaceae bacterium]